MMEKARKGFILPLCMLLTLSGCGNGVTKQNADADIVLLDPVGAFANYETVAYRSIYQVSAYTGGVYPAVTTYSFETEQIFSDYQILPGEEVQAGTVLFAADTTALEEQITDMQELLAEMETDHAGYVAEMEEEIAAAEEETAYRKAALDCLDEENQDSLYVMIQGNYRQALYQEEMLKKELEQTVQLYELDLTYQKALWEDLMAKKEKAVLTAKEGGTVVAAGYYSEGDTIRANTSVVAVADMESKLIKCDYISANQIAKAKNIYAYIDGKRYAVLYQKMDAEEYAALTEAGADMYSAFLFLEDAEEVEIGDTAVIVLEFSTSEETVSVSRTAVHKDEAGSYVYVYKDGENCYTPVETGLSDGTYIEIVSGLEAGDRVMVENNPEYGNKTQVLQKDSFTVSFGQRGRLYYPDTTVVRNEVEHGTVYFEAYQVKCYEQVKKGDVIATVRVEGSSAEVSELTLKLTRMEERMQDYHAAWAEENAERDYAHETEKEKAYWQQRQKAYDTEMESRRESIAEVQQEIEELQRDYATCQIVADRDGIVMWLGEYDKEDVLQNGVEIASIADAEKVYLLVENTGQMLQYGTELEISVPVWKENGEETITVSGKVVSMANAGLDADLYSGYALVKFMEEIDTTVMTYVNERGEWRRTDCKVSGVAEKIDNVIVVPKEAVTDINGNLYVNVLQEDGSVVTRSFVAGGHDLYRYWVITGLEEGMTVCYE